jgi:hypothetical protein
METCENCRSYATTINQLLASMKIDKASKLEPRKIIRQHLLSRFDRMNKRPSIWYQNLLDKLKFMLGYRIPVYQAMLATAVVALFILIISQAYLTQDVPEQQNYASSDYDSLDINLSDVRIHMNFIDEEKMGRNLREDSILARYIIKSL